jgi:hypothetical protein
MHIALIFHKSKDQACSDYFDQNIPGHSFLKLLQAHEKPGNVKGDGQDIQALRQIQGIIYAASKGDAERRNSYETGYTAKDSHFPKYAASFQGILARPGYLTLTVKRRAKRGKESEV